jgi:hypothetical protein
MGIERGWEEDCIFERESVHQGASSEGIWLEEGITKWVGFLFYFTFYSCSVFQPYLYLYLFGSSRGIW